MGFAYSLWGQLGAEQIAYLERTGEVMPQHPGRANPYLMIDYTFEKDPAKLRVKAEQMGKLTAGKRLKNKKT